MIAQRSKRKNGDSCLLVVVVAVSHWILLSIVLERGFRCRRGLLPSSFSSSAQLVGAVGWLRSEGSA